MKLEIASPSLQFPFPLKTQAFRRKCCGVNHKVVCNGVFPNSVKSRKFLRSQNCGDKFFGRGHSIRSYCGVNLDGLGEEPFEFRDGLAQKISRKGLSRREKDSIFPSQFDFLEPAMLGIVPEPPNWPEREAVLLASIEQKAKNFELPLSLRMIKKKQQWEVGVRDLGDSSYCSVKKAFSSMVFIIVELQSYALQMREALCDEELELIVSKVKHEMHLSFAWMFKQVFSQTPNLMIHVMTLLVDFSVYSASRNVPVTETSVTKKMPQFQKPNVVPDEFLQFPDQELSESETKIWNSIVDEATNMGGFEDVRFNHGGILRFVSPFSVEIDSDESMEYYRTDFLYQRMLSQDPYNTLLLCNYAQFLQLVTRNYDRAEECFKRAVQVKPLDAEALSRYADFLWVIRNDLSAAEDIYQQAIAVAEPGNSYYPSQYANFLWNTGGEDTCFPLNASLDNS